MKMIVRVNSPQYAAGEKCTCQLPQVYFLRTVSAGYATGWSQVFEDVARGGSISAASRDAARRPGDQPCPLAPQIHATPQGEKMRELTSCGGWPIPKVNRSTHPDQKYPSCFCGSRLSAPKSQVASTEASFQICPSGERFTVCKK